MYKIKVYADVRISIDDAANWYENQSHGLGTTFKKQVKADVKKLQKTALLYAPRYRDVRCMLIKNFPFMVHNWLDSENSEVHVYGIYHTSLDPKIWKEGSK